MNKRSVETKESISGLITVESVNSDRDVIIYIREARDAAITAEASIRISPEMLYELVHPIMRKVADDMMYDTEVF